MLLLIIILKLLFPSISLILKFSPKLIIGLIIILKIKENFLNCFNKSYINLYSTIKNY